MSYYINTEQQIGMGNPVEISGRYFGGMRRFPVIPYTPNEDNDPNPSRETEEDFPPEDYIEESNIRIREIEEELTNPDLGETSRGVLQRELSVLEDLISEYELLLDNQAIEQEDQGVEESKEDDGVEEGKVSAILQGDIQEGDGVRYYGGMEPDEEPMSIADQIRELRVQLRNAERLARQAEDAFHRQIFRNQANNIRTQIENLQQEQEQEDIPQEDTQQEGQGLLVREAGQLEPSGRQLLSEVGNEEIKTLDIVRTPLSSFTKTFLNIISLGQFEKISKKYYDEMFHLSLWINGKYNLEKNEVVKFNRSNPREAKSQTKSITAVPAGITIQQLIDNTIKRMGPENFSNYDAERLNCQNFLLNVLDASGIGDNADKQFIFQDATKIFQELPQYAKVLGKVSVKLGAIFNRLIYGEGSQEGGASIGQIGEAAALRNWIGRYTNPDTGRPMRDTLNAIVHSGDPSNSAFAIGNPYYDINNEYKPEIDDTIDWAKLRAIADRNKRGIYFIPITYPSRTLGAT
jgi:hypothetical protein